LRLSAKSTNVAARGQNGGEPMRRFLLLAGATLIAMLGAPLAAAADKSPPDAKKALSEALEAYRRNDCARVASLAAPVIATPASTDARQLSLAYDLNIDCAWKAKDLAKAGDYAKREIALDESSDFAWRIAIVADFEAKHPGAALDTIDRMLTKGRAGTLNGFPPAYLLQKHNQLEREGDAADDARLLAVLANPAYDPDEVSAKVDGMGDYVRALYARKLVAAGKRDEARAMAADLEGYQAMMEVAFDPGLRALRDRPVDFLAAVEADLARHRAMLDRYPHALSVINAEAMDLYRLGRNDDAIALLNATKPHLATPDAFDDLERMLPWFWNALGYAYLATGKYDEMVDSFAKGGQLKENGAPNVSQMINLADQQVVFGRAKEALATLDRMGAAPDASPYGLMQVRIVRGCAYAELGQVDKARADLSYAMAHESDDPATVTALDLCLGDEDAAAASYVRRLAAPVSRRIAMMELADYDTPDPRTPKSPFAARADRVQKRPEVVAAIRAAGGPVRIHLQANPF
jgi:tetratricopeptide (TPR) repeat protein